MSVSGGPTESYTAGLPLIRPYGYGCKNWAGRLSNACNELDRSTEMEEQIREAFAAWAAIVLVMAMLMAGFTLIV